MTGAIDHLKYISESDEGIASFNEKIRDFFPAIIYLYDTEHKKIRFLNQKLSDLLGYSVEDADQLPDSLYNYVFKDDAALVKEALEKFCNLPENGSHSFDARLTHKEGSWRYFRTTGKVVKRGNDNKASLILCVAQEIDQAKSQEEVNATRELMEGTESLLQFGSWSWDLDSGEITCTAGLYAILEYAYEPGEALRMSSEFYLQHIVEPQREKLTDLIAIAAAEKTEFEFEYLLTTKNGKQKVVSSKGKVVTDKTGKARRILGMTRDVTAVKNFEKEREHIIRELNRSNRDLEEFAYVASHDLQEPLRKISTFGERLKTQCASSLDKDGTLYLSRILASTDNMRILIDNLLEFSKTTRSSRAHVPCSLNVVVQHVLSDQELKIEETKTTLQVADLPEIEAVPSEMRQLFNNLLSNALKFRKKEADPVIRINATVLGDAEKVKHHLAFDRKYYKINFIDNGIGFEQEYAEKIFQIFQRLHGKAEYPGAGIGLAICKKIVDNHDGIIYASSAGNGATFTIILPQKQ
jgi:PAS domain S-box-containing protein